MSTLSVVIVVGVVLVLLGIFSPPVRRFFGAAGDLAGAKADRAAEKLAQTDPVGVLKSKIADAVEQGRNNQKVVELAGQQLVSLQGQIENDVKEKTRLENRIKGVLAGGDPNKTAQKYATDLARVEEALATNQGQLASAQEQYDTALKLVERYEREIADTRKDADRLGLQLQQSESEKQLYQMTAALKDQCNVGGELAEARRRVKEAVDANKGAAMAARDLSRQTLAEEADDDLERKAAADAVLARFRTPAAPVGAGVGS